MPKKSRKKRTTPLRSQGQGTTSSPVKPLSQNRLQIKDDLANPSRYAHIWVELKMIGIFGGVIIIGIFIVYFLLR